MKFGLSSSGCEPRPAKGEPAQPVASLATVAVTWPAMRRHASVWAVGQQPRKFGDPGCRGGLRPRRRRRLSDMGWRDRTRRGVRPRHAGRGRSRHLGGPRSSSATIRSDGDPVITPRRAARLRMRARPADATPVAPRRRSIRAEVGRWQGETGVAVDGDGGVGGLHTSFDVGERGSARTRPSKGGPCGWELLEGTKADALTSALLSSELQEVAERGAHPPYALLM
jgi:hypothetical protein